jgi:hypothetical protein
MLTNMNKENAKPVAGGRKLVKPGATTSAIMMTCPFCDDKVAISLFSAHAEECRKVCFGRRLEALPYRCS